MDPPTAFGKDGVEAVWRAPASDEELGQVLAAHYLHQVSIEVMLALKGARMTRKELAERLGENAANVRRKLNGEYPATLEDILRWAVALDEVLVLPAPGSVGELFPDGVADNAQVRRLWSSGD